MTTLRKANVNCPKCGHGFVVRDNGGLSKEKADKIWAASDVAFAAMDRAFKEMDKAFRKVFDRNLWK